jgi:methyl-accepting chemotaxis protein WspA
MQTSIWHRLNTALILLVVLLLAGVGLTLWVERTRSAAMDRSDKLSVYKDRIFYDVLAMSDSLRGLLLDPKSQTETKRTKVAQEDLASNLTAIEREYVDYRDLVKSVKELRDFLFGRLDAFQRQAADLAESDPVSAPTFFNRSYAAISQERDHLFRNLSYEVDRVKSQEEANAQWTFRVGVACLLIILLAIIPVGRLQSKAVTEPLNGLVTTLESMRRGDFTKRLALDRNDEFGVLNAGLNRLAEDLSELFGQVQRSGIQVNTTATEISATARQQQSTAHEIAATTAQIGATSKEISATSRDLVKTMNEVNHVAEETGNLAGSGQTSIARMEATMKHLVEASSSITARLAVLSERTININSVVTTITKVADQTNLLSLNAAIEAEKAGEYGLGFAVVAMEIRRLADQTAVATYDIEKMVKEMQSAVSAGVMGMDKFTEEVRRGVQEVQQVSAHLAQIIHQVQTLTPRFQTVNAGMHAQATGAQQISETLSQLSEAAQQTADSLRHSNNAIEQLNGAARGLQTSVARFKLGDGNGNGNGH